MRKIIVAGNWKMNKDLQEAMDLYSDIVDSAQNSDQLERILIFPPFPFLHPLRMINTDDFIQLGSQNIAANDSGAFTGEVSAGMIKSLGVDFTLIGHSERRSIFGETDEILKKKVDLAVEKNLNIVFCCGEQLEERKSGREEAVIYDQLKNSLFHLGADDMKNVIIAYEPVWAIGTGETATSDQAESMHAFIRGLLSEQYGQEIAQNTHILYGGSCNSGNSVELFGRENVDGGLIGGASLKSEEFLKIIAQLNG